MNDKDTMDFSELPPEAKDLIHQFNRQEQRIMEKEIDAMTEEQLYAEMKEVGFEIDFDLLANKMQQFLDSRNERLKSVNQGIVGNTQPSVAEKVEQVIEGLSKRVRDGFTELMVNTAGFMQCRNSYAQTFAGNTDRAALDTALDKHAIGVVPVDIYQDDTDLVIAFRWREQPPVNPPAVKVSSGGQAWSGEAAWEGWKSVAERNQYLRLSDCPYDENRLSEERCEVLRYGFDTEDAVLYLDIPEPI